MALPSLEWIFGGLAKPIYQQELGKTEDFTPSTNAQVPQSPQPSGR